jgi:lipopolysaccharide export system permease protein
MIFQRAAIREFTHTAAGVFVALFAILMTTQLIRLLGQAAGGKIASEAVIALLGFGAISYLPVLLSLTLFVAILMTLSRWYRDSEMVVWLASGIPLTAWIKPVLGFVGPPVIVIAILSLLLAPWATQKSEAYRQTMDQRDDVARRVARGVQRVRRRGPCFFCRERGGRGWAGEKCFHQLHSAGASGRDGHGAGAYRNDAEW